MSLAQVPKSLMCRILIFAYLLFVPSLFAFAEEAPEAEYQAGEVLVQVEPQTPLEEVERIAASVAARVERPVVSGELYLFSFDEDIPVFEIIEQLEIQPAVQYAEPNYLMGAFLHTLGDPSFTSSSGGGGSPVVVAVVDTGIDFSHPGFSGHLYVNGREIAGDGIDNDGNGYVDDVNGFDFYSRDGDPTGSAGSGAHGTQVAGRVLQGALEGRVEIMPLKVGPGPFLNLAAIIEAIRYAADNGARIINMSFGSSFPSVFLQQAVEYAAQKGALLVAAAGNNGWSWPSYPAAFSSVISVASSNAAGRKSWFSNFGPTVDFTAVGERVTTTTWGGGTTVTNGTSFSAPFLAGVAARILASSPGLTAGQVVDQLARFAANVNALNPFYRGLLGAGLVNDEVARRVAEAFPLAQQNPPPPPEPPSQEELQNLLAQARQEVTRLEADLALADGELQAANAQKTAAETQWLNAKHAANAAWLRYLEVWRTAVRQNASSSLSPLERLRRINQSVAQQRDEYYKALAASWEAWQKLWAARSAALRAQEHRDDLAGQLDTARRQVTDLEKLVSGGQAASLQRSLNHRRGVESALRELKRVHELLEASPVPDGFGEASELAFPGLSDDLLDR